ncbi:hypothetical protein WJX84_003371 [Apatococcus fuscideae]|uniref:Methionine aminopeptidase n=1 Tax=Apatococcus fuscideae TaxID=2026836 RepID=A0AAW1S5Y0_9CHLO
MKPCLHSARLLAAHSHRPYSFTQQHGARSKAARSSCLSLTAHARKGLQELLTLRKPEQDNILLKQGNVSRRLPVPDSIARPSYVQLQESPWGDDYQIHNTKEARDKMRAACRLAAEILQMAGGLVKPGVTTDFIDRKVHEMAVANGAYPSPLGYGGFPKSVCTSVNECLCHGIPDSRELRDGDTINIDVTVYLNGYHGDTSSMFRVGNVSEADWNLCTVTEAARDAAITACGPGVPINRIGQVIQEFADKHKYGCVKEMVGHGVGTVFHCAPPIFHTRNREPGTMQPWQTFTIEPIFTAGAPRHRTWKDHWTMVTKDGQRAAQYEHTILITDKGHEILTKL